MLFLIAGLLSILADAAWGPGATQAGNPAHERRDFAWLIW
jgi:hypothetical protein